MQIRIHEPGRAEEWEATLRRSGGHALHLPAIYLADHDPAVIHQLEFVEDGVCVGCALALDLKPGRLGRLRGHAHVFQLPTAPAVKDPVHVAGLREALFAHARESGASRLVIQPAWGESILLDEDLAAWRTGSITEFVLDLGAGHEALLAGMHKVHRKNIRRAGRAGIEVVEDSSVEALLRLRELQVSSSERAGSRTEGFAVQEAAFFRKLHEHVYGRGPGSILFAKVAGQDVAALAWVQAAGRAQTVRSGSCPWGTRHEPCIFCTMS